MGTVLRNKKSRGAQEKGCCVFGGSGGEGLAPSLWHPKGRKVTFSNELSCNTTNQSPQSAWANSGGLWCLGAPNHSCISSAAMESSEKI